MNDLVKINNGELMTTSKIIADVFGKSHRKVTRDIKELDCSEEFRAANFIPSTYVSEQNKTLKCFNLTANGAMFLCMGFTGSNASVAKEELISMLNDSVTIASALSLIESIDFDCSELFIYVAQESLSGRYKIGVSKHPESRVKQLNTGNPEELVIIYKSQASEGFKAEAELHKAFNRSNIRSEWFSNVDLIVIDSVCGA